MVISLYLFLSHEFNLEDAAYKISYEYINTKDMATTKVAMKCGDNVDNSELVNVELENISKVTNKEISKTTTSVEVKNMNNTNNVVVEKSPWRLPTEQGIITTWPNAGHVALDITSSRGIYETIYPVADGTVSSIYTDSAGALIVTVHHVVDGINYTSQYVHLSSYAPGLYVGKFVTTNDPLGQMGSTGRSTGPHLHISVTDCTFNNSSDPYCSDLNGFFRYMRQRYYQGFQGLNNLTNVPYRWYSR